MSKPLIVLRDSRELYSICSCLPRICSLQHWSDSELAVIWVFFVGGYGLERNKRCVIPFEDMKLVANMVWIHWNCLFTTFKDVVICDNCHNATFWVHWRSVLFRDVEVAPKPVWTWRLCQIGTCYRGIVLSTLSLYFVSWNYSWSTSRDHRCSLWTSQSDPVWSM